MQIPARSLALVTALLGATACSEPTGPSGFEFLIQVRAVSEPDAPADATGPARAPGVSAIEIQEAVVVFGGFRLEPNEDPTDFVLDESEVVPLRLDGGPTLVFAPAVPEGEYRAIEVFLDELDPAAPGDATLIDVFPRLEGVSLLVAGEVTRNGVAELFEFSAPLASDVRLEFPRPRTFSSDAIALPVYTVLFALDQWFQGAPGVFLDPNDEADRQAIEASIAESMQVVSGGGS